MRCVAAFWRKPSGTAPAREAKGCIARQHFGESYRELRRPGSQKAAVQAKEGQLMQQERKAGINSRCSGRGKELALWNWQLGIYTQTF